MANLRYLLLAMLVFSTITIASACSCSGNSTSFNLADFDAASYVLEITGSKYVHGSRPASDQEAYLKAVKLAKEEGLPEPPPPPPFFGTVQFSVKVETVYKGNISGDTVMLSTASSGAACGWQPRERERYVLYLYEREEENGETVIGVSSCSRSVSARSKAFFSEKHILEQLANSSNGDIIAEQKGLFPDSNLVFSAFSGSLKDGKRTGRWIIYPPLFWTGDSINHDRPIAAFYYDDGVLSGMNWLRKIDKPDYLRRIRFLKWKPEEEED